MKFAAFFAALIVVSPALADDTRSGVWTFTADVDAAGRGLVTALSPAPGAGYNEPGYAIARCLGNRTEFLVGTNGGWGLPGQHLTVVTQVDGAAPVEAKWDVSTNGKAVFLDDKVEDFFRTIPDDGKLRVAIRDNTGQDRETIFPTTGFGRIREMIAKACGWAP